jgi:hypothetical protein
VAAAVILAVALRPGVRVEPVRPQVEVVVTNPSPAVSQPPDEPVSAKPRTVPDRARPKAPRRPAAEPLLVKLVTDDPDVVIYWIADDRGDLK